ncbi:Adenine DNA glycosylase [bacterium HR23]|nr:Adenine DNA glycosylase [bacterium HR23]
MSLAEFQRRLLAWHREHHRPLPWRETTDPYAVLVSEVMLQQTGVERVLSKYRAWLERWPTWEALAGASLGEVIRFWEPLGYNRRALWLHRIAQRVVGEWGGTLPAEPQALESLPGIGPYTRNAVLCFAFGRDVPVLDTNIRRVLGRALLGVEGASEGAVASVARGLVPAGEGRRWNLALMDLGATVCLARRPLCDRCPVADLCAWRGAGMPPGKRRRGQGPFPGSTRYYRGRILARLRRLPLAGVLPLALLCAQVGLDRGQAQRLMDTLRREGLVQVREEGGDYLLSLPDQ